MSDATLPHDAAVADFRERVREVDLEAVERLVLFGSVARDSHSRDSDVDVLAVLSADADESEVEERLRDLAYDTMLEFGTAISIHAVTEETLDRRADHPFFRTVLDEGRPIDG